MKTKIVEINPERISKIKTNEAAELIKKNQLVAIPTETVYGLGANALNPKAVKKIFKAKQRPADNPLIVHISNQKQLKIITKEIPEKAKKLIKNFWPGPLTLILKKTEAVPDIVTAGRNNVGVRMPSNKIALRLIKESKLPIAAPSANSFSKPSPTLAKHVYEDMKEKIPLILDGGPTKIGIESTIIDMTQNPPILLRPGEITKTQIEKIIGKIRIHKTIKDPKTKVKDVLAPGMKYRHYSPKAKVILLQNTTLNNALKKYPSAAVISINKKTKNGIKVKNLNQLANKIFSFFREMDEQGKKIIIIDKIPEKGIGISILNRVKKAANKIL